MKIYAKSGFAILIIGERGTGKSEIAAEFQKGEKFYKINCASLEDDSKAEAELFGYVKGAFTGADQNGKAGLFDLAKNGTLFFDEIHRLSKRVQDKLMLALQTDSQNRFQFRPISSNEEKYTKFLAIFATNLPPIELSKFLLPDFYDRIAQLVIELPPLRETRDDIEMDWKKIWHQLRFSKPCPSGQELFDWLRTLELPGNYRDLQKIAIYYNTFLDFPLELRSKLGLENALDFTKKEYKKYQNILAYPPHNEKLQKLELPQKEHPRYNFRENARAEDMIQEYRLALAEWVLQVNQGNLKKSAKQLEISTKTLQNWQKKGDIPS
ncbi:MAG: sigma 54-interacting transcriptional regulator [Candidatus Brocadiae bacterium]|nr:sigma 54-interacting transcriptional regulator [Candidatus Brocadiia bacterium]